MELLLNLLWLLLALPAYWLWRDRTSPQVRRRSSSFQCLLALGCALVILFPVISATDDLQAMRAEMEESPTSKRSVCHKTSDKPSDSKWHSQPSLATTSNLASPMEESWHSVLPLSLSVSHAPVRAESGRAPPAPPLA